MNPAIRALWSLHSGFHRTYTRGSRNQVTADTRAAFTFMGYHWATSPKERMLLPEGIRAKAVYSLLTEEPLQVAAEATATDSAGKLSDVVVIGTQTFEVSSSDSVGDHPIPALRHYTYVLVLENPA